KSIYKALFFHQNWYLISLGIIILFTCSFFIPIIFNVASLLLACFLIITIIDFILLFRKHNGIHGKRITHKKHNLGDNNNIILQLQNNYNFDVTTTIIEELPVEFQIRNFDIKT